MKNIIFFCLFLLSFDIVIAENDTIQKKGISSQNTKSVLIEKGRRLLLDKFIEGDYKAVDELEKGLNKKFHNEDYLVFYPVEEWLIKYWTKDYKNLIHTAWAIDSINASIRQTILPERDDLFMKLREKSYLKKSMLIDSINNSTLADNNKEFLKLFLLSLIKSKETNDITQDSINLKADKYLEKYPYDEMNAFIRKYIRYKLVASKWSYGIEFFGGSGIFTKNLRSNFKNSITLGVDFDIGYKNFILFLRDNLGFCKTRKDIMFNNIKWDKGSSAEMILPEASVGYIVEENRYIRLAPFAGIIGSGISPSSKSQELQDKNIPFASYSFGLNMDIKLGRSRIPIVSRGLEHSYWFVRLRYTYIMTEFSPNSPYYNSAIHNITIGIGAVGRKIKRSY